MSDVPPPTNAFEKMMAAARGATATPAVVADEEDVNEPVRTAVLYEAHLEHADPEEPLLRVLYFGQVVRLGTAEAIFKMRKREHELDAAREDKDLGFHAVIDMFGPEAIAWRIVSSKTGPRSKMQAWANAEEIRLIDAHGGVLQDMDAKRTQTLNLTKGGQGDARAVWAGIDAMRRRALNRFKAAMEAYVEAHGSALVPREYVDEDGHPLGEQLHHFRQGQMRKGLPEEEEINAWAKTLTGFHWDARESDAYREGFAQRGQERSRKAFAAFKEAMEAYVEAHESALVPFAFVDAHGYALGERLAGFRKGEMHEGTPWEDEAKAWADELTEWHWDARKSDAYREELAQRGQERSRKAFAAFKAAMKVYVEEHESALVPFAFVDAHGYALGERLAGFRKGEMRKGLPEEEEINAWADALPGFHWDARESDAYREELAQRGKDQAANRTAEQEADRLAKLKTTMATDASKAKRQKISTDQLARERHAELVRARLIKVPFVKSKKRRVELRAASTDLSGKKGNAVLYMVSEDGATIRRVQSDGNMGKKHTVGPVVDPVVDPPSAEAGPSDLNAYVSDSESESD